MIQFSTSTLFKWKYSLIVQNISILNYSARSRHAFLIITQTGQQRPLLYKGDKSVSVAACSPEGGAAGAESLLASSLPWSIDRPARIPDSPLNSQQKFPFSERSYLS